MNTCLALIPAKPKAVALVPALPAKAIPRQTSHLPLLPSELLIMVVGYLHITDINSLQLTCSRFYWIQPMMSKQHPMHNYLSYLTKPSPCEDFFCFCCNESHRAWSPFATATPHRSLLLDLDPTWRQTREFMAVSLGGHCTVQFQYANSFMNSLRYGPRLGDADVSALQCATYDFASTNGLLRKSEGWNVRVVDGQLMVRHELRIRGANKDMVWNMMSSMGNRFLCKHHWQNVGIVRTKRYAAHAKALQEAAAAAATAGIAPVEIVNDNDNQENQAEASQQSAGFTPNAPNRDPEMTAILQSCDSCHTDTFLSTKENRNGEDRACDFWAVSYYLLGYLDVPWEPIWREHGVVERSGCRQERGMEKGAVCDMWQEEGALARCVERVQRRWTTEQGPFF